MARDTLLGFPSHTLPYRYRKYTTFAWFTDTATTGVNKIQSGKLDVKLSYLNDKEWKEVSKDTKLFDDNTLWEPGHTEVAYLKVENAGNLALKYKLSVNVANEVAGVNVNNESFNLSDYIKMGVVNDIDGQKNAYTDRNDAHDAVAATAGSIATYTKTGSIAANGAEQYVTLVVYMPETAGNEANYKENHVPSIDLGVTLVATQDAVESDSFDSSYDEGAVYPITAVGAVDAVDGTVKTDVTIFSDEQVEIDENVKASAAKATIPAGAQLTNDSFIEGGYYNTGTVTVKDCSFNAITTSNIEAIDLSMEKNVALTFEGSNVFDGRVATDADKPEGAADMKLYSTQSIKAYRAKTVNGKENVTLQGMVK